MDCIALQAPLSMGFPSKKYWSGLPFPSSGDLPNPGIEPALPCILYHLSHQGSPHTLAFRPHNNPPHGRQTNLKCRSHHAPYLSPRALHCTWNKGRAMPWPPRPWMLCTQPSSLTLGLQHTGLRFCPGPSHCTSGSLYFLFPLAWRPISQVWPDSYRFCLLRAQLNVPSGGHLNSPHHPHPSLFSKPVVSSLVYQHPFIWHLI